MKKFGILFLIFFLLPFGAARAAQVNKVAAVVNGQIITFFDLQREAIPDLARARLDPAKSADKKAVDEILRKTLDGMIMDILIAQEARRLKVSVSPDEINKELDGMMKARGLNRQQMESQLAQQKMSINALRENIGKNILRSKIMSMEIGRKIVVTPDEIREYYERNKDSLIDRDGLHMGVLVYSPKANAESVAAQIKSGKLSFSEASARYSIAPNRDNNGDTGAVQWDRLNPEWDGRLKNMKPGDVTDIFILQGHKAQVYLFRPGGGEEKKLTLDEARPQIDMILRQPKAKERFADYSRQLRDKAVIDVRL